MYFIRGKRIGLRPVRKSDVNETYCKWLNDPVVNRYSQRRNFPTSEMEIDAFLNRLGPHEKVLAVCALDSGGHIGNIKYGPIDWYNRTCDISIVIGERNRWGEGLGTEAIYLVSRHLFENLDLHRLEAGSANPAFERAVVGHLGWTKEGELRERFFMEGKFVSHFLFSLLRHEFQRIESFEDS